MQIWMGYNAANQLQTKGAWNKVTGQLNFLDYLLLSQEITNQRAVESYTDYNLNSNLQPI